MTHVLLIACAVWAGICIVGTTIRQVRDGPQDYMQTLNMIALIIALGFLGLGA